MPKHTLIIDGRKTAVSLEEPFWHVLQDMAKAARKDVSKLASELLRNHRGCNRSSTLRVAILRHVQRAATPQAAE